jgi:acyl carrier protein
MQIGKRGDAAGETSMTGQTTLEAELAELIVAAVNLETSPAEIVPELPLFEEGLGLDSIDALEIGLAISKRYGVSLRSDDVRVREAFASLRALARHIAEHRTA